MTTAVVPGILKPLLEKLASSAVEELELVCSITDDREKLKNTLETIQRVLADAERRQTKDEAVGIWLSKLKEFCYDAEDVLDDFEARASWWRWVRSTKQLSLKRKVSYLFSWISNFIFQFKIAHNMKELRKRLDGINEEKSQFNLSVDVHDKIIVPWRETHSFVTPLNMIGRNEEKEMILELLRRSNDGEVGMIGVISILGMGGIGKTALTQLVYNDDWVNRYFDLKVWLSMPVGFETKNIIIDILESLGHKNKFDKLEMLQNILRSIVWNKRCLFVMDNIWEVRREDWVELRDLLGGVAKGSKVIVTSRNMLVASIMGSVRPLNLTGLSWNDSFTLFVKCAFDQGQEKNHPDLMKIGNAIVRMCWGNPLAVKTLGSLLYSKYNESDWAYVRASEMWQLQTDILPSLRISYDLMPSYLKQCFAYCSIFLRNCVISSDDLISLWISNGLVQSSGDNRELEEIGWQYVMELCSRSFFDVSAEGFPPHYILMHNLVYELAILVARTEWSIFEVYTAQDITPTIRHVFFGTPTRFSRGEVRSWLSKLRCVRTISFDNGTLEGLFSEASLSQLKHLRVLWTNQGYFDQLHSSIGGLKHLRLLSLSNNLNIKKLPESVCELHNLYELRLAGCRELKELPANIKNMVSLRTLSITTRQQRFPENGIGCLTSLRSLSIQECYDLEALFDDIDSLMFLRSLFIGCCPKLASLPQGLKKLMALEDLSICNCKRLKLPEGESKEENFMLMLRYFRLEELPELVSFPGWLEGSASTLQRIRIEKCPNLSAMPEWLQNSSSLRSLKIEDCPRLSSLPDGIRRIATLTELQIINCEGIEQENRC